MSDEWIRSNPHLGMGISQICYQVILSSQNFFEASQELVKSFKSLFRVLSKSTATIRADPVSGMTQETMNALGHSGPSKLFNKYQICFLAHLLIGININRPIFAAHKSENNTEIFVKFSEGLFFLLSTIEELDESITPLSFEKLPSHFGSVTGTSCPVGIRTVNFKV